MRLTGEIRIPRQKLTKYLLVLQPQDDKSQFLALAGFTQANPDELEQSILQLIHENDAVSDRVDEYGTHYQVTGFLVGPKRSLSVTTVWIFDHKYSIYRFITLKPFKE